MPRKTIEAVVEIQPIEGKLPWAVAAVGDWSFLRLFSGTTVEEIGSLILTACSYNSHLEVQLSAIDTLNAFLAEDFVLPGGLRFSENEQVKVVSGCCCGLEDWRKWLDVPSGNIVWAGHDPTPGVEFVDGGIRVWQDEKADGVDFIDFGVDEMRVSLEKVESDLKGFVVGLGRWADFIAPELKPKIIEHFAKNMNI
jgi:hypothetical protein